MVVLQPVSLYIVNMNYWLAEVFELEINSNNQLKQGVPLTEITKILLVDN